MRAVGPGTCISWRARRIWRRAGGSAFRTSSSRVTAAGLRRWKRRCARRVRRSTLRVWESPADVIPLPAGWSERARPLRAGFAGVGGPLEVLHFDPYSVVLRLVARGDEPDYVAALEYARRGWVNVPDLEAVLTVVVPRFTSETLAQDPAEFRRKFRGLRQLIASDTEQRRPA